SVRESSDGIVSHPTTEYMDGLVVGSDIGENNNPKKTNIIDVIRTPIYFVGVNNAIGQEDFELIFRNNLIRSKNTSTISKTHGFEFSNNIIEEGGIRLENAKKGKIVENIITSTSSHGIRLDAGCSD